MNRVIAYFEQHYPFHVRYADGTERRDLTHGFTPKPGCLLLQQFVRRLRPESILQVGVFFGYGAVHIAEANEEWGQYGRTTLVDIDQTMMDTTMHYLALARYADQIEETFVGDSQGILPELVGRGKRFDLMYVDGGHEEINCLIDLECCQQLARDENSVILTDDAFPDQDAGAYRAAVRAAQAEGWHMTMFQNRYAALSRKPL